jgi:putative transposase
MLAQRRDLVDRARGLVQLDGVGRVRFRVTQALQGRLRSVTISIDAAGRWFACFTADQIPAPPAALAPREAIGVDLGLKNAAVLSTGEVFAPVKALSRVLRRLRRYQRRYARGRDAALRRAGLDPMKPIPKGTKSAVSKRMRRTQRRVGVLHARVVDVRRDFQHKVTRHVVAMAAVVGIEDLSVRGITRSMGRRGFRRSAADAGLGEIRRQLTYKAEWHGRTLAVVDRFYPSSKTCAECGTVNGALKLERSWACLACGTRLDRDRNAAVNLEREALRIVKGCPLPYGPTPRSGGCDARGGRPGPGSSSPDQSGDRRETRTRYRAAKRRCTLPEPDGPGAC